MPVAVRATRTGPSAESRTAKRIVSVALPGRGLEAGMGMGGSLVEFRERTAPATKLEPRAASCWPFPDSECPCGLTQER